MRPITVVRIIGWTLTAIGVVWFLRTTPSPEIRDFSMRLGTEIVSASRVRGELLDGEAFRVWEGVSPTDSPAPDNVVDWHGYAFRSATQPLSPEDVLVFKQMLTGPGGLQPWSGSKPLDPFKPEVAVEWTTRGRTFHAVLCFRRGEIRILAPGLNRLADLGPDTTTALRDLLAPYCRSELPVGPATPTKSAD